jgi:hypothetical protein
MILPNNIMIWKKEQILMTNHMKMKNKNKVIQCNRVLDQQMYIKIYRNK